MEWIHGFSYGISEFGLERVAHLHESVGAPERSFRTIHIAGTKGKGSVAAMLANALTHAGWRVGLFTSPDILGLNERIQIDAMPIASSEMEAVFDELAPFVREMDERHASLGRVSAFEMLVVAAFLYFARRNVDFAVVETGLGGRFDATNICEPSLAIITNVARDHTHQLGETIREIAFQKGGIIKPGVDALSGAEDSEAIETFEQIAAGVRARLFHLDTDFPEAKGVEASDVAMHGRGQLRNAALVRAAAELLARGGVEIAEDSVAWALRNTRLPGRLEVAQACPPIILDAAHTPESLALALEWVRETYSNHRLRVLFAVSEDKNWRKMLRLLEGCEVFFTQYEHPARSASPKMLAQFWSGECGRIEPSARAAFERLRSELKEDEALLVVGSFFLLKELSAARG